MSLTGFLQFRMTEIAALKGEVHFCPFSSELFPPVPSTVVFGLLKWNWHSFNNQNPV